MDFTGVKFHPKTNGRVKTPWNPNEPGFDWSVNNPPKQRTNRFQVQKKAGSSIWKPSHEMDHEIKVFQVDFSYTTPPEN